MIVLDEKNKYYCKECKDKGKPVSIKNYYKTLSIDPPKTIKVIYCHYCGDFIEQDANPFSIYNTPNSLLDDLTFKKEVR